MTVAEPLRFAPGTSECMQLYLWQAFCSISLHAVEILFLVPALMCGVVCVT